MFVVETFSLAALDVVPEGAVVVRVVVADLFDDGHVDAGAKQLNSNKKNLFFKGKGNVILSALLT
jgi:hypothetical protein